MFSKDIALLCSALDDIRALQYQFSDATANLKVIRSKLHDVSEAVSSTTRRYCLSTTQICSY